MTVLGSRNEAPPVNYLKLTVNESSYATRRNGTQCAYVNCAAPEVGPMQHILGRSLQYIPEWEKTKVTVTPKYLTASPDVAERSCTFVSRAIPDGRSALM